jgi:taurine dioxygenase
MGRLVDDLVLPYTRVHVGPYLAHRTPPGAVTAPYERFGVRTLGPSIGAVLEGMDLGRPLDEDLRADLERALYEFKVLVFPAQDITAAQHRAFAGSWGAFEDHPFLAKGDGNDVVRFELGPDRFGTQNEWHSDVSFYEQPTMGSVLRCIEAPPEGGDTLWANMELAYENLSDDVKARIEGRTAVHHWRPAYGRGMDEAKATAFEERFPAQEHPIVRTHPFTGRRILYVNQTFTTHVVGMDPAESNELLAYLTSRAMTPEYQVRWHWTPGDVIFWDNRATQHYACSDYHPHRRVMERVGIVGEKPF